MRLRYKPATFKTWALLEDAKANLILAAEEYAHDLPEKVYAYLSVVGITRCEKLPWDKTVGLFFRVAARYAPKIIPLLDTGDDKRKPSKPVPWDYLGRTWFMYLHMFADRYGWDEKIIASLPLDTGMALLQEMLTNDQLEHEFIYSLSETAYLYDKSTKKNKLKPLERPVWMHPKRPAVKKFKTKIPKKFLPIGNVIMSAHETRETKETESE